MLDDMIRGNEWKRKEQKMKKIIQNLLILAVIMGMMLGMAVIVLANNQTVGNTGATVAADPVRAMIAAVAALAGGVIAFIIRHHN